MKLTSTQRLLAVFALVCLLLSLALQGSARTQMDAQMMPMSVIEMGQMDSAGNCGRCDEKDMQLADCVSGTCVSVPAVLNSATMQLRPPHALLRAPVLYFHASLPPAPELQPPRLTLIA
jgi:hypothetical protein